MLRISLTATFLSLSALGWALWQGERLKSERDMLKLQLNSCTARQLNRDEDQASDEEIDSLSNDDLRTAPLEWLLPAPADR